jgi:hypothetical protein
MREGRIAADGTPEELARMGGGPGTELEVSGDLCLAGKILRECARGARVVEESAGEGRMRFVVYAGGGDFRERIFRSFAAHSGEVSLNTLGSSGTDLEDLFIRLTNPEST